MQSLYHVLGTGLALLCLICSCGQPAADSQPPPTPTRTYLPSVTTSATEPAPPAQTVKLVFIHHSSGENWLVDEHGGLGAALAANNYFVSDTNYGWGPPDEDAGFDLIGDHTDIGHWFNWFAGPHRDIYLEALYAESEPHAGYTRLENDPGGTNQIVMFKSCFPNSNLSGCLLYTSPSPRDRTRSRMPSSA